MATLTKNKNQFRTRKNFLAYCKAEIADFMSKNQSRVIIEYVRNQADEGRGEPTAVLVAYLDDTRKIQLGWSAARPDLVYRQGDVIRKRKGDVFNKTIGLWKAICRATGQGRPATFPVGRINFRKPSDFLKRAEEHFFRGS